MDRFLTRRQLHNRLEENGHTFSSAATDEIPIDVCPSPENYLTVGVDPDGTLKPAYRARYFACVRSADDSPRLLLAPQYTLQGHFATAAAWEPGNNDFVRGPVRWLLVRFGRFRDVWLWPRGGFRGTDGLDFLLTTIPSGRIDRAPHLAHWFKRTAPQTAQITAVHLHLGELADCLALWEAANLVGAQGYDFFLSDAAMSEVYLLHHHDKIIVSIPDQQTQQYLLRELTDQTDLFEDWSGYECETDEAE